MNRDYYGLWLRYKHSGENLSQFAKRVGISKSTLSVAFRVIEQMERKYSYYLQELEKKEKELRECRERLKASKGGFLRKLFGG